MSGTKHSSLFWSKHRWKAYKIDTRGQTKFQSRNFFTIFFLSICLTFGKLSYKTFLFFDNDSKLECFSQASTFSLVQHLRANLAAVGAERWYHPPLRRVLSSKCALLKRFCSGKHTSLLRSSKEDETKKRFIRSTPGRNRERVSRVWNGMECPRRRRFLFYFFREK